MIRSILTKIRKKTNPIRYWKTQGLVMGEYCEIYSTASFGSEPYLISLGNHVRVNAGVQFITHDGGVWVIRGLYKTKKEKSIDLFGPISVGNNCHIGTYAIILPGVKIGNNCIVGCNAIVTKDVPDNSVVVGIPARVIETIEEYEKKHKNDFDYTKLMDRKEKKHYLKKKYMNEQMNEISMKQ